jgi:hypothetical protein
VRTAQRPLAATRWASSCPRRRPVVGNLPPVGKPQVMALETFMLIDPTGEARMQEARWRITAKACRADPGASRGVSADPLR